MNVQTYGDIHICIYLYIGCSCFAKYCKVFSQCGNWSFGESYCCFLS